MLNVTDPLNNLVFDCHNYFNSDNSGGDPTCVNGTIGVERLGIITKWLKTNKLRVSEYLAKYGCWSGQFFFTCYIFATKRLARIVALTYL